MEFPNILLDPSKIRDRWGLAALGLVVWLTIAYIVLSSPALKLQITLTVLVFTFILLLLVLMLSFKGDVPKVSKPPPNTPSRRKHTSGRQMPTAQEIKLLDEMIELYQKPEIQQFLKEKLKDTQ